MRRNLSRPMSISLRV
jgi:hypothetical protein